MIDRNLPYRFLRGQPLNTYPVLFENGYFFLRLSLPSTLTNALKLVTENAPFQKPSPESRFLKTSAFFYVSTDETVSNSEYGDVIYHISSLMHAQ